MDLNAFEQEHNTYLTRSRSRCIFAMQTRFIKQLHLNFQGVLYTFLNFLKVLQYRYGRSKIGPDC